MNQAFQAGDILVGCSNVNGVPPGYMGHSAIVVDPEHVVEAVVTMPNIRRVPISVFQHDHPIYVQLRPKSAQVGQLAALCALDYLQKYQANLQRGQGIPPFAFRMDIPLQDPWSGIYCSKLVWLSYYYGAQIAFPNDFGLFTPEDLATNLSNDPAFQVIYQHPEFRFLVDS